MSRCGRLGGQLPERSNGAISKFDCTRPVRFSLVSKDPVFNHSWASSLPPCLVRFQALSGHLGPKLGPKGLKSGPGLPALGPCDDHIGLPSAAAGTDEPLAPIEDAGVGAVPSSRLDEIGLDLMLARLAPHDNPDLRSGSERHQRAAIGLHCRGCCGFISAA